jgi:HK97 family phage major capsid protein
MSRLDLSTWNGGEGNGYIVEESSSTLVQRVQAMSAIESLARREAMATSTKLVPLMFSGTAAVYEEGDQIAEDGAYLGQAILQAKKWASIMHISEEDLNDTFVDVLNKYKGEWASDFAKKFDNACLGVDAAENGTTVPYTSLYRAVSTFNPGNVLQRATVTFQDLNDLLKIVETGDYNDPSRVAFIAHPSFASTLRGLVDDNNRPILQDPLAGTTPTLFGVPVKYSFGAIKTSTADANQSGNPLIMVGNMDNIINGVRAGIESQVSRDAKFDTDGVLLKIRARRAFTVGSSYAFGVLEKQVD